MQQIVNVYKPQGATPLEVIQQFKQQFPRYKDEKISYAGRLDPLAHGILLLLLGEQGSKENNEKRALLRSADWRKNRGVTVERDSLLNLPKEYEFEAVFGMETDTYDVLGLLQKIKVTDKGKKTKHSPTKIQSNMELFHSALNDDLEKNIQSFIKSKLGKHIQQYPPFSSKPVQGKPLFRWAKENKLAKIEMPEREIEIFDFQLMGIYAINKDALQREVMQQIESVHGDFRQKEIQEKWEEFFAKNTNPIFRTARFTISCSSGTYIRSLVHELGKKLEIGAITLEILRTKVGEYELDSAITLTT